jgi:hypothetical protein
MAAFPHYYFRHCEEQSDEATQFFFASSTGLLRSSLAMTVSLRLYPR